MPGARCARSLACKMKKAHEHSHHGHTGITRHSPRNGFTAYSALSPVSRALLPPSPAGISADLTPASGCQDHTTLPSASRAARLAAPSASTASRPASVTCATPLCGTGRGRYGFDLGERSITPIATDWHDGQTTVPCKADY